MNDTAALKHNRQIKSGIGLIFSFFLLILGFLALANVKTQGAVINETWWTYQQDCNGDGCWAGQLAGNLARLNWEPAASNCDGTVTAHEIIYSKPCASSTWTAIYTNAAHVISGCSIENAQFFDIAMGSNCACSDYKIEIYTSRPATPDWIESPTNDPNLSQHKEQLLSEDICLSDFFSTAAAISGTSGSRLDDSTFATKEPGEPNHAGNPGGKSLWYKWTAPNGTTVTFDTIGSSFDTLLGVYTGTSVSNLSIIATNDDINGASNRMSRVAFTPTAGATYHIAVDGYGGGSGFVVLNWNQTGTNLPDLVVWGPSVNPVIITNTFGSNDCEYLEGCEPIGTRTLLSFSTETRNIGTGDLVMGDPSTNSLFYWAACHQHYHFEEFASYNLLDTNGNSVAAGHKVGFCLEDVKQWSSSASPTIKYNCNFQGIQAGWADVYAGYGYIPGFQGLPCQYIDITGVQPGSYTLKIVINPNNVIAESNTNNNITLVPVVIPPPNCNSVPPNNNFANAIVITNLPFSYNENNQCASKESGEPAIAGNAGGHSVWFQWTPAVNQTIVINTKASSFDTLLGVYTGTSVNHLTLVATNDDIIPQQYVQSQVTFAAVAGTPYYIGVDGWGGAVGNLVLNVAPPGNDDFSAPFVLSGTAGTTNGYNYGGSKQLMEPAHAGDVGGHSIWYNWTAPINGPVDFNTWGSDFDTTLAVYTGGTIATNGGITNLTAIVSNHNDPEAEGHLGSRVDFTAVAGKTYKIAVDGFGGGTGNVQFSWNMDSQIGMVQLADGTVQVTLTGVDWQRYSLLGSADFVNWNTNVAPITMAHGLHAYPNFAPTNNVSQNWFYRGFLTGQ